MFTAGSGNGESDKPPRKRRARGGAVGGFSHAAQPSPPPYTEYDVGYFRAYAHLGVHEEMLKDRVRTETYRNAIMSHRDFIAGKVVLDVGCGTGILSIFCAQAGARQVYAVDASEIALQAMEVVNENNLADKITVIHGRIEDVAISEKVDVIVSEWMGYVLLYESMLGSIIFARDKWLKPGGLILPSHATLYLAPVTHSERYHDSIEFWLDVYGIKMSSMMTLAKQFAFTEPSVETISGENVLTWPSVVIRINCYTIQVHELESVTATFKFSSMLQAPLHGFAFWFDVEFNGPALQRSKSKQPPPSANGNPENPNANADSKKLDEQIILSTAPEDAPTHWQQTLIYLFDPIELRQDQIIEGSVTLNQNQQNARYLNIYIKFSTGGQSFVKESLMQ